LGNNRKRHSLKISLIYAGGTFIASTLIFIASELFFCSVAFLLGLILLILIIFIGILFDIIGVAAAASHEAALNAKAAKKIFGAREAVYLVKNADKVSSFCNDLVGDISGTVSGAIGTALIFQFVSRYPGLDKLLLSSFMAGVVASLTVGGKAFAKGFAIHKSNEIIFWVGKLIRKLEVFLGLKFIRQGR